MLTNSPTQTSNTLAENAVVAEDLYSHIKRSIDNLSLQIGNTNPQDTKTIEMLNQELNNLAHQYLDTLEEITINNRYHLTHAN
jgi:hypothetical protein